MAESVTLEFLGRQMERMLAQQGAMRDELRSVREDMHVLTSIVLRHDSTLNAILEQLHAMTAQHNRFDIRLRRLEEERAPS
jgi:hypothetical protein